MTVLLNNVNTDTESNPESFDGGQRAIVVRGDNFGGGDVSIQARSKSDPSSRFAEIDDGNFTTDGTKLLLESKKNLEFRAVLANSTNPVNVFAEIV